MLSFDWEQIHGRSITGVFCKSARALNDSTFSCDRIVITVDGAAIEINVDIDTDELMLQLHEPYSGELSNMLDIAAELGISGKQLGWVWAAKNYRGYEDAFMMAFGDIVPDALTPALAIVAAASSLSLFKLTEVSLDLARLSLQNN